MKNVIVRYETKRDRADENQKLIERVFAELAKKKPAGIRYRSFRASDGVTFVHVATIEARENPLRSIEAFREFTSKIDERCEHGPITLELDEVGSYGHDG